MEASDDTQDNRQSLPTSTTKPHRPRPPLRDYTSNPVYHKSPWMQYLTTPIAPHSHFTPKLLLLLALSTGVNDAATWIDYHIFVSNQTGNTVFLSIGLLTHNSQSFDVHHVGLSLGGFCIGGILAGQITAYVAAKRARWWLVTTNMFQTMLTFTAAGLRQWYALVGTLGPYHGNPQAYSVVALLAVSSGLQVAMARDLGVPEVPTGMITTAMIDLVNDEHFYAIFWRRNSSRDRRAMFVICILIGGFVGAAAHLYCSPALPLLLAGIIKAVVTVGFFIVKAEVLEPVEENNKEDELWDERV